MPHNQQSAKKTIQSYQQKSEEIIGKLKKISQKIKTNKTLIRK